LIYNFYNKETGEYIQEEMLLCERIPFLEANPHLEQVLIHSSFLGDSVKMGITKPPADFQRGIIDRIAAATPGNQLKKSRFGQNLREI